MSNWKKIDDNATNTLEPAASAVPVFIRRNVHGLSESRHVGCGMSYRLLDNYLPITSSGSYFTIEVPYLIPVERWATALEATLYAEAFIGDVEVSLIVEGNEGVPVTFTATGSPQVKTLLASVPPLHSREFYRASIKIQSEYLADAVTVNATLLAPKKVRLKITSGVWNHPEGKTHGQFHLTTLPSESAEPDKHYFGASNDVGSSTYEVEVWPPIFDDTDWVYDSSGGLLNTRIATVSTMSQLEITGIGFELRGNTYNEHSFLNEPYAPVKADTLAGLAMDITNLRFERSHWFSCSFINNISSGNIGQVGVSSFGGIMAAAGAGNTPGLICAFPVEIRENTLGLQIGLLWSQTGTSVSRQIKISGTIGGFSISAVGFVNGRVRQPNENDWLFTSHGQASPLTWGCEDAIGSNDISELDYLVVEIPWPSGVGILEDVQLEIEDNNPTNRTNNVIHLHAVSAREYYGELI